jgi:uncharacterized membrane protein YhaH (DUF805 family)
MKHFINTLKQYANFKGNTRRKEFWMYVLFHIIFGAVAVALDNILGISKSPDSAGPIYGVYILATLIPSISVTVRRLHDIGNSGWWIFLGFIPVVGSISLLIMLCWRSANNPNLSNELQDAS